MEIKNQEKLEEENEFLLEKISISDEEIGGINDVCSNGNNFG